MRLILFALFIFVTSCNTDSQIIINKDEIVPLSIANNFTMTYTDSAWTPGTEQSITMNFDNWGATGATPTFTSTTTDI